MEFIAQFKAARRVSTPLVAVRTFDAKSTINSVAKALGTRSETVPLILWDAMQGMTAVNKAGKAELAKLMEGAEPDSTIPLTETLRMATKAAHNDGLVLFVSNAHMQWKEEAAVIQGIWNLRDRYKADGNMLVLLCNPGAILPTELVSDVLVMDEPLPTLTELQATVKDTFKFAKLAEPSDTVIGLATDALIGLPAFPAEQAAAMCINTKAEDKSKALDIKELWSRKRQIIGQTPGLSVWDGVERVEDIGGIQSVKNFCQRVVEGNDAPKTIIFIDEIEKAFAGTGTELSGVKTELTGAMLSWMQDTEMDGTIFIGLPGVSKSNLAKAVGGSYGIPVINFDLAGMQSGLVGSSNANLRAAQSTVDAISGGRVLAIATCNSIGALPPELRRRFNLGIFFFDAPSAEERTAIWGIYRTKYNIPAEEQQPNDEGWTGAEIKECCKKAYRLRMTLAEAATYIVPVTRSSAEQIHKLRLSSSGKYLSASQPGVYHYAESDDYVNTLLTAAGGRLMRD